VSAKVVLWSDYVSPYAFVAKAWAYQLEADYDLVLEWRPYTLDIASFQGSVAERDPHHWRRVRYAYMDARRWASKQGLTLKGPKKIFCARPVNTGMLYAQKHGVFRAYNDEVFARFWKHDLDIEDPAALADVLERVGADTSGFAAFVAGDGPRELMAVQEAAEAKGVFGVPSFLFPDGDLYWGREHLPRIREILAA
jgi:2-hydroxychromene-2-carboxylate isomerase